MSGAIKERFEKKVPSGKRVLSIDVSNISDEEPFLGDVVILVAELRDDGTILMLDFFRGRVSHLVAASEAERLACRWDVSEVSRTES